MTADLLDRPELSEASPVSFLDNVIPSLVAWRSRGERCALATLVGVDGNAPRAVGAQMAVTESGQWSGYISGGCLEQAIALEAVDAIRTGAPRLLRYGKGSPYFDIRLPCGSGLDVFVQPMPDDRLIRDMAARLDNREAFALRIDLSHGTSKVAGVGTLAPAMQQSVRHGNEFVRFYAPSVRCLVVGSSPIAAALSGLAASSGFETVFYAPDPGAVAGLSTSVTVRSLMPRGPFEVDAWTAAILAFHDHEQEVPIFAELLDSQCFFIGAIGSRNAHAARRLALEEAGYSNEAISRIKSPAGLIAGLKSAPLVALSILAQIVADAREQAILA
jgi:xanthine dehydrogenase accessory factor